VYWREKKNYYKILVGKPEKKREKTYRRQQQYTPVTGIYNCRYCSHYLCV